MKTIKSSFNKTKRKINQIEITPFVKEGLDLNFRQKKNLLTKYILKKLNERGAHRFDIPIETSYTQLRLMGLDYVCYEHGNGGIAILQITDNLTEVIYMRF